MKTKALKQLVKSVIESSRYSPMCFKDLAHTLDIHHKKDRQMLEHLLSELVKKGKIARDNQNRYVNLTAINHVIGLFHGHPKGFGFVTIESDVPCPDIFIPPNSVNGAMDMDRVEVRLSDVKKDKRDEGEILNILEHGRNKVVGRFEMHKGFGFVIPDNEKLGKDIFIPERHINGAQTNNKVLVNLTVWPESGKSPEGRIEEVLGDADDPQIDALSVFKAFDIPMTFTEATHSAANALNEAIGEKDLAGRTDLRNDTIFTIDGDDSKDFDDAVSLTQNDQGNFILGVHIADVSHYLLENDLIDKEAYKRGTSIYAVDQVIPMLPFNLSNNICSLKPNVDRLTLSCTMEIDKQGNVLTYKLYKSVIHSCARMTYKQVNRLLEGIYDEKTAYLKDFEDVLLKMRSLMTILRNERRIKRGSIDFDFPEAKITLNKKGFPTAITTITRGISERIIEEFMLIANETVAAHMEETKLPFIFRNHPSPNAEKISAFQKFIGHYGFSLGKENVPLTGTDFQKLQHAIETSPEKNIIMRLMLRTMQQAVYEDCCNHHYALGAEYYTHFTSPIRRYPDLMVHRAISSTLKGSLSEKEITALKLRTDKITKHCSECERRAESIEREINKIKMVEFMSTQIGKVFEGQISGVTSFGFFVELPNTVEGLVKLQSLKDDYYNYDETMHRQIGERFGKIYSLGQSVKVRLTNTNLNSRQIDFEIV